MAKASEATKALPAGVAEELLKLGANLAIARKRRRMSRTAMAERIMVNPKTVERMEKGDPAVGIGILATALWVMGMQRRLGELSAPESDAIGLQMEIQRLPNGFRRSKKSADKFDF
jgi:transcriptional regulator with XRE-family HTH domain